MEQGVPKESSPKPVALVDMGSNGIRLSITDLAPPTARLLPTLYHHRVPISLYDAQHPSSPPSPAASSHQPPSSSPQPIPPATITRVATALRHFRAICTDFHVPENAVRVLATEATRTAPNSQQLRDAIRNATGWDVAVLDKAEEGRIGAWGVAWSLERVRGLVMDLGGGSTQMTWVLAGGEGEDAGEVRVWEGGSVSLPFGAAALMGRLGETETEGVGKGGREGLKREVCEGLRGAFEKIEVPQELVKEAEEEGGMDLYLSGGGFRGWGYLLMSQHPNAPYPIPIINGFTVPVESFRDTERLQATVKASQEDEGESIFRISERRASQVPAVAFLVQCLTEALPVKIKEIIFTQGGVREGALFSSLEKETRAVRPLDAAVRMNNLVSAQMDVDMDEVFSHALPSRPLDADGTKVLTCKVPSIFVPHLLRYLFPGLAKSNCFNGTKETNASVALRITTAGALASALPLSHQQRAALALALCVQHGGFASLPPEDQRFFRKMQDIVGPEVSWWCNYVGSVGALLAAVYPAGNTGQRRIEIKAVWSERTGQENDKKEKKGRWVLNFKAKFGDAMWREAAEKALNGIEKVGKRKNWIHGREGVGWKISVEVE
ncbi:MAG: hypothetical protein M1821_002523 [Bathelium mastoideum]|nr:MAG: hypothetical protein M1821_002523 [Bathelium mastoideum]